MSRGIFITFEGVDGSGKTTQIHLLAEYCRESAQELIVTREPGGTSISEKIRQIILDPDNAEESEITEALLYAAARAQHVAEKIKPALERGAIVLCDRFLDSSIAYQAYARGLGDDVRSVNLFAVQGCMPDMTFFLDIDPETGQQRQIVRGKLDRLEQEGLDFQRKVYEGYKKLISEYGDRFRVIDADRSVDDIQSDIRRIFSEYAYGRTD